MPPLKQNKPARNGLQVIASDVVNEDVVSDDAMSILSKNRIAQEASKLMNKEDSVTVFIHRDKIYPNPLNKKYMTKITEDMFQTLKISLLSEGLVHNLAVIEDAQGRFRLLSGEKRWNGFMRMTEEEYRTNYPNGIETKIIRHKEPLTQIDEHILLLTCNVIVFSSGSPDPEQLRDLISLYLKKGYEKNELVEYLGCYLEDATQTIYKFIGEAQAIDELYDLYNKGVITRSALQCLGGLKKEEQEAVYRKIMEEDIDKVDQELAFELKKAFKTVKRRKKAKSPDEAKSTSFVRYGKALENISTALDKNNKIKLDVMNEMELAYTSSRIENIINKLKEQKSVIDSKVDEKRKQ